MIQKDSRSRYNLLLRNWKHLKAKILSCDGALIFKTSGLPEKQKTKKSSKRFEVAQHITLEQLVQKTYSFV
jgi:hypothetical protein